MCTPRGKSGVVREELPGHAACLWGSPSGERPDATHGGSWLNASKPEAGPTSGVRAHYSLSEKTHAAHATAHARSPSGKCFFCPRARRRVYKFSRITRVKKREPKKPGPQTTEHAWAGISVVSCHWRDSSGNCCETLNLEAWIPCSRALPQQNGERSRDGISCV